MHQKKHSGKPHNRLPEVGKYISEACKAVQPFNSVSKHATHLWFKKKWKENVPKGNSQLNIFVFATPLCHFQWSCFPCISYGSSVKCLGYISSSELCRLPFGSTLLSPWALPDPYSAKTPNSAVVISCLKRDDRKEVFCT